MAEIETNQFECQECGNVNAIPGTVKHGQHMLCTKCKAEYEIRTMERREGLGVVYSAVRVVEQPRR